MDNAHGFTDSSLPFPLQKESPPMSIQRHPAKLLLLSAALICAPAAAIAQESVSPSAMTYADIVDLADSAPLVLRAQIRQLQAQGVHHFAWYPDDFIADQPSTHDARAAMSAGNFPYPEK